MFSFLKRDPLKALRRKYDAKLEQAMLAQRSGNLRLFADLTAEAEQLWQQYLQREQESQTSQN